MQWGGYFIHPAPGYSSILFFIRWVPGLLRKSLTQFPSFDLCSSRNQVSSCYLPEEVTICSQKQNTDRCSVNCNCRWFCIWRWGKNPIEFVCFLSLLSYSSNCLSLISSSSSNSLPKETHLFTIYACRPSSC
jgi:hypothetical protein